MDADELEPVVSGIHPAMRHLGRRDDDVSGRGVRRVISDDELGFAAPDHPCFRIRVHVQAGALSGRRIDEEKRNRAAGVASLEPDRAALAGPGLDCGSALAGFSFSNARSRHANRASPGVSLWSLCAGTRPDFIRLGQRPTP